MLPIKAYFDESGNTGCVLLSDDGILNFKKQPVFAVGSVIVKNAEDEKQLIEKYKKFKQIAMWKGPPPVCPTKGDKNGKKSSRKN